MFSLWVQNERGETYELTHQQDKFIVSNVEGLGYPVNNINISPAVNVDGGRYNSAHLNPRNIVITVHFVGYDIETRRHDLYKMLPAKSNVKVMYKCKERHVYTEGYVEVIDVPIFVKHEIAQISIICPDAYWHDFSTTVGQTSYSLAMFKFPEGFPEQGETISVRYDNPVCRMRNNGDTAVGFTCKLTVDSDILEGRTCSQRIFMYNPGLLDVYVPFPTDWFPDGERVMRVYKNGTLLQYPDDYTPYWVDYDESSGRTRDLRVHLTNAPRLGDTISVQTQETYQGRESREYLSGWQSAGQFMTLFSSDGFLIPKPSWYDGSSYINVQLTGAMRFNGEINPETVHAVPDTRWDWEVITQDGNEYISVKYTYDNPSIFNEGNLQAAIYGDEYVTTVRIIHKQDVTVSYNNFTRYVPWDVGSFDSDIGKIRLFKTWEASTLSPLFPNGEHYTIVDSVHAIQTDVYGEPFPADYVFLFTNSPVDTPTREQFIMPMDGETDIREWTDEQLNIGLGAVTGVRVTNTTTGEYFEFLNLMFNYYTQPITISTETGNLYAIAHLDTDIPILYDFSGKFFKLQPGVNILEVTSTGNQEYLHGEFTASQLWAGV